MSAINLIPIGRESNAMLSALGEEKTPENNLKAFLAEIQSENADVRYTAWAKAAEQGADAIPPLADLLESANPGIAKAALEAIKTIVHSVGKDAKDKNRRAVIERLLEVLDKDSKKIRMHALRYLSHVAFEDAVPKIVRFMKDPELREEAVFCLERIPGHPSAKALLEALSQAPEDFKPRIMGALGLRKEECAIPFLSPYVKSDSLPLQLAALKALARIGSLPVSAEIPSCDKFSGKERTEYTDSVLRLAEAQAQKGNSDWALKQYNHILQLKDEEAEEHWICAAIIGVAKIEKPAAVELILTQLGRKSYIARDTAKRTLIALKSDGADAAIKQAADQAEGDNKSALEEIIKARKQPR